MFLATLAPFGRTWVVSLLIIWAVLLFGGFAFGSVRDDGRRRMPAWTRLGSSLSLVLAAWSWLALSQGQAAPFPLLIACGMTLGFTGDLFMAGLIPAKQPTLGGMLFFGLGHVAYISGIVVFANRNGLTAPGLRWGAWIAWLLIGTVGWYVVVFRCHRHTPLHWAALPYALLLASTAGFASGLALQAPTFQPLASGAALLLVSDLILAARLFNHASFPLIDDLVWFTYGPGQMLIVYSIATAVSIL